MTRSTTAPRRRQATPPPVAPQSGSGHLLAALLGVALAAVSILAMYFYVQNNAKSDAAARDAAGEEARRAACYYVPDIVNFDYRNLDPFFAKIPAGATGDWKQGFTDTSDRMRKVVTDSQMVSEAGDTSCGLVTADEKTATVVVAVAQHIVTASEPTPRPAQVAIVAVMEKHDGEWLCAKLDAPLFA